MSHAGGESLSSSVLHFLDSHQAVTAVHLEERPPASLRDIAAWERQHAPLQLPPDVLSFYALSDGMQMGWSMKMRSQPCQPACVHRLLSVTSYRQRVHQCACVACPLVQTR